MAHLSGTFEDVPVDAKCRINIPASLRKGIPAGSGDTLVISPGLDGCLEAQARETWEQSVDGLQAYPITDPDFRKYIRQKLGDSYPSEIDGQGRILVQRKCLERAGIHDRVTIVGMIDKIEFWEPEKYRSYIEVAREESDKIAERFTK